VRRAGGLWDTLVSYPNLWASVRVAARGKRSRPDVAAFLLEQEVEVPRLRRELESGEYRPSGYRTFLVRESKPRLISAAPFRDRVVHHALSRVVEPVLERRFTVDSFACRRGFGTHRALDRARRACDRHPFVLKCDIVKYFPSIDHEALKALLARAVKCRRTLELAALIVDGSNPQPEAVSYFPGDTLFTPYERRRGLPLGNQTSQLLANLYLNPLDHHVRRHLRPADYVRYCDDFLLFGDDRARLEDTLAEIEAFLCRLRLRVHPRKSRVYRTREGVTFLGWRLLPGRTRLVRSNVVAFRRRLRAMQAAFAAGEVTWGEVAARIRGWLAHAEHGDTWRLRRRILSQYPFRRGTAV